MNEKIVAVIQARMGSSRLPGKVLKQIAGRPMLAHVVRRTRASSQLDTVVVATSTEKNDDEIVKLCAEHNVPCYRGSETDVLDRYYQASRQFDADIVVRITADCPLVSPALIDRAVRIYRDSTTEYVSNKVSYDQPIGLDVEVLSLELLEEVWQEADQPDEREHVTLLIRNSERYNVQDVPNPVDTDDYNVLESGRLLRLTVDYPTDLRFIRNIYDKLSGDEPWLFDQIAVYELLERHPELISLTHHADRSALR